MFHFRHHSGDRAPSGTQIALHSRLPRLVWIIATIFSLSLVFGIVSIPALAATGAPTLKVVPKNVGIPGDGINCNGPHSGAFAWICHVTLTETQEFEQAPALVYAQRSTGQVYSSQWEFVARSECTGDDCHQFLRRLHQLLLRGSQKCRHRAIPMWLRKSPFSFSSRVRSVILSQHF